jgi:hypothetical protein
LRFISKRYGKHQGHKPFFSFIIRTFAAKLQAKMIRNLLLVALGGAVGFGMMKAGDVLLMALYVGASVIIGILAVWGGMMLSNISIRG